MIIRQLTKSQILNLIAKLPDHVGVEDVCYALQRAVELPPTPPPLYTGYRLIISRVVTIVSGAAAVITALAVVLNIWTNDAEDRQKFLALYAFWAIMPPLWFFVEYTMLFDGIRGNPLRDQDFKNSQELSQKIWAAFLVLLGIYALINWNAKL